MVGARDDDHGQPRHARADGIHDVPAGHTGQREVGDDQIPGPTLKAFQPFRTIRCDVAVVPQVLEKRLDGIPDDWVIVDEEDASRLRVGHRAPIESLTVVSKPGLPQAEELLPPPPGDQAFLAERHPKVRGQRP